MKRQLSNMNYPLVCLVVIFLIVGSIFNSCSDNNKLAWHVIKKIQLDKNLVPTGISNFNQYVALSDSSSDRIIMIDTLDGSFFQEILVEKPVYINIRKSRLIIPSFSSDTVFLYRGEDLYPLRYNVQLDRPVAADAYSMDYHVLVSQIDHQVILTKSKNDYLRIGEKGNSQGQFNTPSNVTMIDSIIYVVDSGNKRIQKYDKKGNFVTSFGESEEFIWPSGIAYSDDQIFVSDAKKNEIYIYSLDGNILQTIRNGINGPTDINYFDDKLFVANLKGPQITILKYLAD
ncbi:MAG: hypothetical protein KJO29_01375 [Bacteroidia bacterium]|nr:hypothetical protein [Bacteroidia bacterium]